MYTAKSHNNGKILTKSKSGEITFSEFLRYVITSKASSVTLFKQSDKSNLKIIHTNVLPLNQMISLKYKDLDINFYKKLIESKNKLIEFSLKNSNIYLNC